MAKLAVFTPSETGLQAILDLQRFTGAIQGYAVYQDGLSITLPQPVMQRARLWESFCKKKGLGVGPHDGVVIDLLVPDGNQGAAEPEKPQEAPAQAQPAKRTRKAPAK